MGKLRVFTWIGYRRECPPTANGNRQTREVCAAPSKAAVGRLVGESPRTLDMSETGNEASIARAMSKPGVVFWMPLDARGRSLRAWTGAEICEDAWAVEARIKAREEQEASRSLEHARAFVNKAPTGPAAMDRALDLIEWLIGEVERRDG